MAIPASSVDSHGIVVYPSFISIFVLSGGIPTSRALEISFPLSLSYLVGMVFVLFLSVFCGQGLLFWFLWECTVDFQGTNVSPSWCPRFVYVALEFSMSLLGDCRGLADIGGRTVDYGRGHWRIWTVLFATIDP